MEAISKKFNSPVSLLVKENSKADQFLNQTTYIDKIIHLKRDNKKSERHDGINGFFKLAKDLNQYNFDKVFIFNSSLRLKLISRLADINKIYQYPLFEKKNQHITEPAKNLLVESLFEIIYGFCTVHLIHVLFLFGHQWIHVLRNCSE